MYLQCHQNNDIMAYFPLSDPEWSAGSSQRSGPWTHLWLHQYTVFQSTHQKQHRCSLPCKRCSTSGSQPIQIKSTWSFSLIYFLLLCIFTLHPQTLSPGSLSPESYLTSTLPAPERSPKENQSKCQGRTEVGRFDQCFLTKRKRRISEEEAKVELQGKNNDHKRSRSGDYTALHNHTLSYTISNFSIVFIVDYLYI